MKWHGAHIASMGSGFGGVRDTDGRISFRPRLPEKWSHLEFPLTIRGQRLPSASASSPSTRTSK
jgi:alpha,alpha-trehalose phosphorylase